MSETQTPMTLNQAERVWSSLRERWSLGANEILVGSARRKRETVNDLEFVSPWPEIFEGMSPKAAAEIARQDLLFMTINRDVENPWKPEAGGLFAAAAHPEDQFTTGHLARAVKGLKPGFRQLSLEIRCWNRWVPLQIFRAERDGFGWLLLDRTGPREFGMWFLGQWKKAFNIPFGDSEKHPASKDGLLRDHQGGVVPCDNEGHLFAKIGAAFVPAEERDAFAEMLKAKYERTRR